MHQCFRGISLLILMIFLFCGIAMADSASCGVNLTWMLDEYNGTLSISGTGAMYDYSASGQLPPWHEKASEIYSIEIGNDVTYIGSYAFWGCRNLEIMQLPTSVTGIGPSAFADCFSLIEVDYAGSREDWETVNIAESGNGLLLAAELFCTDDVPGQITASFEEASGVLTISGSGRMPEFDLYLEDYIELRSTPWSDYRDRIQHIIIEDGVTSISAGAFAGCSQLTGISIPDSIVEIGADAFSHCGSLAEIQIPDGVLCIRTFCFENCESLSRITFPEHLVCIDFGAFFECSSLNNLVFPDTLTTIRNQAFYLCSGLSSITLPGNLRSLGTATFAHCNLSDIAVKGGSSSDRRFFYGPDEVYTLSLPGALVEAGDGAFFGNPSLPHESPDFILPDDLTTIGDEAFADIDASYVWIPSQVKAIGRKAFADCANLKYVYLPESCNTIADDAFPDGVIILVGVAYRSEKAETYARENGFEYLYWEDPDYGEG